MDDELERMWKAQIDNVQAVPSMNSDLYSLTY